MSGIIDWKRYFDRIYCLHHVDMHRRLPGMIRELDRVGIRQSGIFAFYHTSTDPWERLIAERVPRVSNDPFSQMCYVNLGLATAHLLREALAMRYQRILILEDDIRFLKDVLQIDRALEDLPDWDVVNLEKLVPRWDMTRREYIDMAVHRAISGHVGYFDGQGDFFTSGGCVAMNAVGMKALLEKLETVGPRPADILFQNLGVRRAVIVRNIACQVAFSDAVNFHNLNDGNTHHKGYAMQGLDYADYHVPDGYGYDSPFAEYEN